MIRLAVRCHPDLAEAVLPELLELAPGGVEEEQGEGYVEYAIYGAPGELPDLGALQARAGDGLIEVRSSEIPDDWADRWADFHKPVLISDHVWVRPSWESPAAHGQIDVVLDPGRAFGTGAHATTRLCVELLVELAEDGGSEGALADWGTGSGVLAIAAAKLGWAPVLGCDHELAALEAAKANADANGVTLSLERINLRQDRPPIAPTVIANLTAPILAEIASRLAPGRGPPEVGEEGGGEEGGSPSLLVCSGMLLDEADDVAKAFGKAGLAERERRASGEWAAIVLERQS